MKGFDKVKKVLLEKGGQLISTEWNGGREKYEYECAEGHRWFARTDVIIGTKTKKGSYCKKCFYNKRRFNKIEIKRLVESKGGVVLTDMDTVKGNSNQVYIDIKCSEEHVFKKRISKLKEGTFCIKCAIEKNKTCEGRKKYNEAKEKNMIDLLTKHALNNNAKFIKRILMGKRKAKYNFIKCNCGYEFRGSTTELKDGK